jgi:hypothetical protein
MLCEYCPAPCAPTLSGRQIRIVYGVTYETFRLVTKGALHPVEEIYKQLKTPAEIIGGVLEEEGTRVYRNWPKPKINHA